MKFFSQVTKLVMALVIIFSVSTLSCSARSRQAVEKEIRTIATATWNLEHRSSRKDRISARETVRRNKIRLKELSAELKTATDEPVAEVPTVNFVKLRSAFRNLKGSAYVDAVQTLQDIMADQPETFLRSQVKQLLSAAAGPVQSKKEGFQASDEQRAAAAKLFQAAIDVIDDGVAFQDRKAFTQRDRNAISSWLKAATVTTAPVPVATLLEQLRNPDKYLDGVKAVLHVVKERPGDATLMEMKRILYGVAKPIIARDAHVDPQEREAAVTVLNAAVELEEKKIQFKDGVAFGAKDKAKLEEWIALAEKATQKEAEVAEESEVVAEPEKVISEEVGPEEVEPTEEVEEIDGKAIYGLLKGRETYSQGQQELKEALKTPRGLTTRDVQRLVTKLADPVTRNRVNDGQRAAALEIFATVQRMIEQEVKFRDGKPLPAKAGSVVQGWIDASGKRKFSASDTFDLIKNEETFEKGVRKMLEVIEQPTEITSLELKNLVGAISQPVMEGSTMDKGQLELAAELFRATLQAGRRRIKFRDNKTLSKAAKPVIEKWLAKAEGRKEYSDMTFVEATRAKLKNRRTYIGAVRNITHRIINTPDDISTSEIEQLLSAVKKPVIFGKVDNIQRGLALELFFQTKKAVEDRVVFHREARLPNEALRSLNLWIDIAQGRRPTLKPKPRSGREILLTEHGKRTQEVAQQAQEQKATEDDARALQIAKAKEVLGDKDTQATAKEALGDEGNQATAKKFLSRGKSAIGSSSIFSRFKGSE